jgi:hypothetical protein
MKRALLLLLIFGGAFLFEKLPPLESFVEIRTISREQLAKRYSADNITNGICAYWRACGLLPLSPQDFTHYCSACRKSETCVFAASQYDPSSIADFQTDFSVHSEGSSFVLELFSTKSGRTKISETTKVLADCEPKKK